MSHAIRGVHASDTELRHLPAVAHLIVKEQHVLERDARVPVDAPKVPSLLAWVNLLQRHHGGTLSDEFTVIYTLSCQPLGSAAASTPSRKQALRVGYLPRIHTIKSGFELKPGVPETLLQRAY